MGASKTPRSHSGVVFIAQIVAATPLHVSPLNSLKSQGNPFFR